VDTSTHIRPDDIWSDNGVTFCNTCERQPDFHWADILTDVNAFIIPNNDVCVANGSTCIGHTCHEDPDSDPAEVLKLLLYNTNTTHTLPIH
jgi:hypothetical protein